MRNQNMKKLLVVSACLLMFGCSSTATLDFKTGIKKLDLTSEINKKKWNHGSENCDDSQDAQIDVLEIDEKTYILRQSKCTSYEAPFIYVFIGSKRIAIIDTGATEDINVFPLFETIKAIVEKKSANGTSSNVMKMSDQEIIVLHTHSHGDHHEGDEQFRKNKNITIIEPSQDGLINGLGFTDNLDQEKIIDLGERSLILFQIPGHQEESIAIYDEQTKWLLTGDTLYPGAVYVKNWPIFKSSIDRLVHFSEKHDVSAVLGAHIEMTMTPGKFYPIGSIYQPQESPLALNVNHIKQLQSKIKDIDEATEMVFDDFVIIPLSGLQKALVGTIKFVTGK
jgi:hydroxyacylglutathione hydrolase